MENKDFCVVVFESTHFAIAAESRLKERSYKIEIIPTPREITASCGLSIKFSSDSFCDIEREMQEGKIGIKGIFKMVRVENGRSFLQIS